MLAALAAVLMIAVSTYHPGDPSFNSAVGGPARNLIGVPGAWVADFFMQTIGQTSWLMGLVLAAWAWRMGSHQGLGRAWIRLTMLPGTLLFGAVAFATLPVPPGWPLPTGGGGSLGDLVLADLLDALGHLVARDIRVIGAAAGVLTLACLVIAMGLGKDGMADDGPGGMARRGGARAACCPTGGEAWPADARTPASNARRAKPRPGASRRRRRRWSRPAAGPRPAGRRGPNARRGRKSSTSKTAPSAMPLPPSELLDPAIEPPREPAIDAEALQGKRPAAGIGARRLRGEGGDHPGAPRPGGHAL